MSSKARPPLPPPVPRFPTRDSKGGNINPGPTYQKPPAPPPPPPAPSKK